MQWDEKPGRAAAVFGLRGRQNAGTQVIDGLAALSLKGSQTLSDRTNYSSNWSSPTSIRLSVWSSTLFRRFS